MVAYGRPRPGWRLGRGSASKLALPEPRLGQLHRLKVIKFYLKPLSKQSIGRSNVTARCGVLPPPHHHLPPSGYVNPTSPVHAILFHSSICILAKGQKDKAAENSGMINYGAGRIYHNSCMHSKNFAGYVQGVHEEGIVYNMTERKSEG